MSLSMELDEETHFRILGYVTETKACIGCRAWKDYLYKALQLELRMRFNRLLAKAGKVRFDYNAVRPLGEDFEESVAYNFEFKPDGTYRLLWARTFDAWSSQSEQHHGCWKILADQVCCETLDMEGSPKEVRYAPAGYKFTVPVQDILDAGGKYFQVPAGARAASWELAARTGKVEEKSQVWTDTMWQSQDDDPPRSVPVIPFAAPYREDARFVDIDGEFHEVSGDIIANWPEEDWIRLMRCRLRFGITG